MAHLVLSGNRVEWKRMTETNKLAYLSIEKTTRAKILEYCHTHPPTHPPWGAEETSTLKLFFDAEEEKSC